VTTGAARAGIIYVEDEAALGGDGLSWATPFKYLQDGLAAAGVGDEIRVAGGVYSADQDEGGNVTAGDRAATFQLISGVGLYGGYGGLSNPADPDERDIALYETTLSGDLLGNDVPPDFPDGPTYDDNSIRNVTGSGTDATAIIDGITSRGGIAQAGGGMYNEYGSPTVSHCAFSGNAEGGMANAFSNPTVSYCTFIGNRGYWGGGMVNLYSDPTVTHCEFLGNTMTGWLEFGEGGGGMLNADSSPTITNCTFSGNVALWGGGGGVSNFGGSPRLTNCTFSGNWSYFPGDGMWSYGGGATSKVVINCIFWGDREYQVTDWEGSTTIITYSDVKGGWSGAGSDNIDADPLFVDPDGPDGIPGTEDDNLRLQAGSLCIDAGDNAAVTDLFDLDGRPRIIDGDGDLVATVDMGAYEYLPLVLGDMNCDAALDPADITPFALALVDRSGYGQTYLGCDIARGDMNGDTFLDARDIQAFVTELLTP
jgi:hypothetical protein